MRARIAVAAVLVCALAACTPGDDSSRDTPDAGPAPQALESAVDAWTEANTGSFTFFLGEQDDFLLASKGDYLLDQDLVRLGIVARKGEETLTTELIGDRDESWSRSALDPALPEGCWTRHTGERASLITGGAFGDPKPSVAFVAQMAVVTQAEGTEWQAEGTVLKATTDLHALVATLGQTWRQLDLDPTPQHRAEVTFLLEQGEIVAWRTDLASILESVRDAGVKITPEMEQIIDLDVEVPVTTGFADLGADVEIDRPEKKDSFDFSADPDTLERNRKACNSPGN